MADELARVAGRCRRQRRPRVHRAGRQAGIAHDIAPHLIVVVVVIIVVVWRHLGAELGLDEVDLLAVALLEGGAVPAAGPELVLTLVDGADGTQADAVHEAGVPLAELNLKPKETFFTFP